MRHSGVFRQVAAVAACAGAFAAPAGAQVQAPTPNYVASDNVEYLGTIPDDFGLTAGANIVGDRMFVTSAKNLSIYDISTPESPERIGSLKVNLAWENEEVPTNGKILGISTDYFDFMPKCQDDTPPNNPMQCLQLFDIRDPANPKELPAVPQSGDHTTACILDCQYMYGSEGAITDLTGVLEGEDVPRYLGNWQQNMGDAGPEGGCHHVREISPGIIFGACDPYMVISVREQDGGSVEKPVVLVSDGGQYDGRFIHSSRWPRGGKDKFAFVGGETNATGKCDGVFDNAKFAVLDAEDARDTGQFGQIIDEVKPRNGNYADGNPAVNALGCSVHWFQEHPTYKNGGLIALAEYDNGTRFLQITREGEIVEQGYFETVGGSANSPKWVPGTDILYVVDYQRGIDILRWNGGHYVPKGFEEKPGREPGTNGKQPKAAAFERAQRAERVQTAASLMKAGWRPSICRLKSR